MYDSKTYFNGVFDSWKTHQINNVATNAILKTVKKNNVAIFNAAKG